MLFITLVTLFAFISINQASDLQKYFNLIDLNSDGKIFSDEIFEFLNKFYEEEPDQLTLTPFQSLQIENTIIKRYNQNSTNNYLTLSDLERLFTDLYALQNQIPTFLFEEFQPEQVHLSYTHNIYNEMFISFVTHERPSSNLRPMIQYCDQDCIAIGDTTTYNVDDWHYWIHFIYIKDLQPGNKYNYKLGFIDSDNKTIRHIFSNELWTFKTMPLIEKQDKEIVYIYGDMGTVMPLGSEVMKSIIEDFNKYKNEQADYVVHVGDIAYAGTGKELEIQTIWDLYMNQIAPISSQIPYMTATGNHEKYNNYTSYKTRFFMPSKTNRTSLEIDGNFYFSFETNFIQWIILSTEHPYTTGSPQRIFLENMLEQYKQKWEGKERPWLIVVGHRPMYSSDQQTDSGRLQPELEPVLLEYGVDLAIWGHMHCYERTTPVKYNITDKDHFSPDGKIYKHNATEFNQTFPIHLTIGTAGAWIDETWIPKPEWSQIRYQKYGFGKLFIYNRTHLEFKSILTDKIVPAEEDSFMIIRQF
jgi:predicted phosphodiesterase